MVNFNFFRRHPSSEGKELTSIHIAGEITDTAGGPVNADNRGKEPDKSRNYRAMIEEAVQTYFPGITDDEKDRIAGEVRSNLMTYVERHPTVSDDGAKSEIKNIIDQIKYT